MQGGHTQKSNTANALSEASLWKVAAELRFEPHRIRSVYFQAGCKAHLLQLLYLLAQQFRSADFLRSELMRQQERATRLRPVFEYVSQNFAENLTLKQGAALASISHNSSSSLNEWP